ncbi:hypothetical protein BX661DRAFT_17499 [Kickxella alabastrina]|uniref:uncharacterized protein n=1 Tax=Kickxella alabastrina TaxID=61397 RepID=UPI00221EE1B1|nr:uncharacterized protein BX661DRAFT_17499 [Kickxella alabastrina]KAI7827807.1 hypothetical protein BX661DRAFT_17499 [Kickxella alabastrina]
MAWHKLQLKWLLLWILQPTHLKKHCLKSDGLLEQRYCDKSKHAHHHQLFQREIGGFLLGSLDQCQRMIGTNMRRIWPVSIVHHQMTKGPNGSELRI